MPAEALDEVVEGFFEHLCSSLDVYRWLFTGITAVSRRGTWGEAGRRNRHDHLKSAPIIKKDENTLMVESFGRVGIQKKREVEP